MLSIGVSIWQMASAPYKNPHSNEKKHPQYIKMISDSSDDDDCSESDNDIDSVVTTDGSIVEDANVAMACDDGCVRICTVSDEFIYHKSLPRVSGKITCHYYCNALHSRNHVANFFLLMLRPLISVSGLQGAP